MSNDSIAQIASRKDFHDALRAALAAAAQNESAEIRLVDPSFNDWPLNERAVVESLSQWVSSRRKLVVLAHSFDEMARRAPRFAEWRRQWAHVIECRAAEEIEADEVPTLLLVPGLVCVRLLDRVHYRGTVSARPSDLVLCQESIDALLQRSVEAFPVTMLGL
jgi:peptidyl-tRNA hydrolase